MHRDWGEQLTDPGVSCICLHYDRPRSKEFLARAVECFSRQTYGYRELLVVSEVYPAQLPNYARWIKTPSDFTVGAKRNRANFRADGDIICHWDDDDYQSPGRIADQVARLQSSGKPVTGYNPITVRETRDVRIVHDTAFWRPGEWWTLTEPGNVPLGPSLCYTRDYWLDHRFADIQVGEDNDFCETAAREGNAAVVPSDAMMYVTNHHANSSGRVIGGPAWQELPASPFPVDVL